MVRCFLSVCIFVYFFLKGQDVKAAQCHQSSMFKWSCNPCGDGTRCIYCQWCTCYCYGRKDTKSTWENSTHTTVQYKIPIIEMLEDLENLIENDKLSNIEIDQVFKSTTMALSEDCERCDDVPEIEALRNLTHSIHETLSDIMMSEENITTPASTRKKRSPSFIPLSSEESQRFKKVALEKTREATKMADYIPESVVGMIEFDSTILKTTTTATTTTSTTTTTTIATPTTSNYSSMYSLKASKQA